MYRRRREEVCKRESEEVGEAGGVAKRWGRGGCGKRKGEGRNAMGNWEERKEGKAGAKKGKQRNEGEPRMGESSRAPSSLLPLSPQEALIWEFESTRESREGMAGNVPERLLEKTPLL